MRQATFTGCKRDLAIIAGKLAPGKIYDHKM